MHGCLLWLHAVMGGCMEMMRSHASEINPLMRSAVHNIAYCCSTLY